MRSFFNTNVNVVINDRADRMNVTGMQLHSVLLGRLRLYLRAMSSSLRQEHTFATRTRGTLFRVVANVSS